MNRLRRMTALTLAALIPVTGLTGCYGKFALTRTIYQANGSIPNKYLRSGLTWLFILVPVYKLSALLDFIVFNTIEFWSGTNPVASGEKKLHYAEGNEAWDIDVRKEGDKVTMLIRHSAGSRLIDTMTVNSDTVTGYSTAVLNREGMRTFYSAWRTDEGIMVRHEDGMTIYRG